MAWNQPGGGNDNNNDQDPWGRKRNQDGPPELDELFKKFSSALKGGRGGSGGNGNMKGFFFTGLLVIVVAWVAASFYTINEKEQGVVLRLGKFNRILEPGLSWAPWGYEMVRKVNVNQLQEVRVNGNMLTKDINIIDVEIGIQYRINSARDYLFNLTSPDDTLRQAAESALRQVVGDTSVDAILTSEKERIRVELRAELDQIMATYNAGLKVETVTLEGAKPPREVNDAFEEVNRSEQDAKQVVQKAEAYRNEKLPLARAEAEQMRQQAEAYKAETLAKANGEVARFQKLLPQYEAAPEVTRQRLYLETMEYIMSNSTKVMVDVKNGNNMMYIPLDQLVKQNKKEGK